MRKILFTITGILLTYMVQSQGILNNGGHIVSETGTYWVVDNGNFTFISQSSANLATMANLLIAGDASLTITQGSILTVSESLTNDAGTSGLVIQSTSDGDGKLINDNPDVAATVKLYMTGGITGGTKFHFFVPPVSSMTIGSNVAEARTALGLSSDNFNGDLISYNESAAGANQDNGWLYFDGHVPAGSSLSAIPFTSLVSSQGYTIYLKQDDPVTFKGSLNGTEHTFTLNRTTNGLGWNLVGNPYPCNYDLTGITSLTTLANGVDKTIYINKSGTYVYKIVNGVGIGWDTDIIPPMQGFFVHVTTTGKSLVLPVNKKTSSSSEPRAKGLELTEAELTGLIRLVLSSGPLSDESVVCLNDKATSEFDGDFDAFKLFGSSTTGPYIYTELGSEKYAINSVHGPLSEPVRIPVSVMLKSQGTYKIGISEFKNLDGINVVLKHGVLETDLSKNASYSFTSAAGTFTGFELIIGGTPTVIDNLKSVKLKTWYSNNFLYINCPTEITATNCRLIIYDMQGKTVYQNNQLYITPGQTIQLPLYFPKGVYATRVIVKNQPYISKIVAF